MAASKAERIEVRPMKIRRLNLTLIGDAPLVTHAWSDRSKRAMLDKQMMKAKEGRVAKDPVLDYADSLYWLSPRPKVLTEASIAKGKFGFPAIAFKSAAVDACTQLAGVTKTFARGAFHVAADRVEIIGKPQMREDMVRVGMGVADIRYRAEFPTWSVVLPLRINTDAISVEQVVNLFSVAGFSVGVGEHRPERNGDKGLFSVKGGAA